jgi:uroporphyrinogen-III synthase
MRIIITRPAGDSGALADRLVGLGHSVIRAPLLEIVRRSKVEIPVAPYQAVALSSANAARAIAGHPEFPRLASIPAFTVGEQSAAAARAAGFRNVCAEGGSAAALAEALIARLKPADGPVLYLSGADVAGDLAGRLEQAGFVAKRTILYEAIPVDSLPLAADAAIRDGAAGAVLLYSPRTARIWHERLAEAGLVPGSLVHYCLSANVADALGTSYKVEVAERPTEASLLALLGIASDGGK